jgi:hypothetical protein
MEDVQYASIHARTLTAGRIEAERWDEMGSKERR